MIQNEDLLSAAIIKRAIDDYKLYPKCRAEVIRFIKSDWFAVLSDLDPDVLIDKLKKIAQN